MDKAVCSASSMTSVPVIPHVIMLPLVSSALIAASEPGRVPDIADLSLEELANMEITSVSRRKESLSDASASIYIITAEAILRSGVTTLPEALRLAPNLQVARVNASQYAISARGSNSTTANKMLVLIDGRTVYTPLFSGVFWDVQDVLLEDIERIEVISGPGGTLWGANAVNGVINIITRRSDETQDGLLSAGGGTRQREIAMRYGGSINEDISYRLYGKFRDIENTERLDGTPVADEWNFGRLGFRTDWQGSNSVFTFQGDTYEGDTDNTGPQDSRLSGLNLLARWKYRFSPDSEIQLQAYYDHTERDIPSMFSEDLDIFDIEFQHTFRTSSWHLLTWGAGLRHARDDVGNSAGLAFLPARKNMTWGNIFVHDQISMLGDRLTLTLGVKAEYNPYTDIEYLPSMRFGWKITSRQLVWGSVSRAVRTPSRIDTEFFIPGGPPFLIAGGVGFESETSDVVEAGYRAQPTKNSSLSITVFHSIHNKLRSVEPTPQGLIIDNKIEGESSGIEAWSSYQPLPAWRLGVGVTWLNKDLQLATGSRSLSGPSGEGNDPDYQVSLISTYELPAHLLLNFWFRHTASLPDPAVPSYSEINMALTWQPVPTIELSIFAENLLDAEHIEFGAAPARSAIDRSVYLKLRWHF